MPIYTLDPRGLATPETAVPGWGGGNPEQRQEIERRIHIQQDYLATVAINTGGRAFFNQSDPVGAMDAILADNSTFYVLGYYPDPPVHDGRFHKIEVTVHRPGARVRARAGYVAPSARPPAAGAATALDGALKSALNVSGLQLRGVAAPLARDGSRTNVLVDVELRYPAGEGPDHDTLRFTVAATDSDGKVRMTSAHAWEFTAKRSGGDDRILVQDLVAMPDDVANVRLAIASDALGRAGSVNLPVAPLDVKKNRVALGGIVVGYDGPPRLPALHAGASARAVPFQPTTDREFTAEDTLRLFVPMVWTMKDDHVTVTWSIGGTTPVLKGEATVAGASAGSMRRGALDVTVPLHPLAPGQYVLTVEATLAREAQAARAIRLSVK